MPYNMESSSNKKADDRIPRRPGYLEKSRHITFRDDTFLEYSPLERRRSELKDNLERNNKKLQKLLENEKTIKDFTDAVKQKNELTFIGEFNSLKKALDLPNENLPDMENKFLDMENKLKKSRAFLDILKTKGINTQELEANLDSRENERSIEKKIKTAGFFKENQIAKLKLVSDTQEDISRIKSDYPNVSFNIEIKQDKIHPIKNDDQYANVLRKASMYEEKTTQASEKLDVAAEPQEVAEQYQKILRYAKPLADYCEVLFPYVLKLVSSDFKKFLRQVENELKNKLGLSEQELSIDEKSLNKRQEELNQHLNAILKKLGLGPSKKLSQAERIAKAEESLKSKHSEIDEALQKIQRENDGLQKEFDQFKKNNVFQKEEFDQVEKRYKPNNVEDHHEEHRDMIHLLSKGGLESMKVYWGNVSKGAKPV